MNDRGVIVGGVGASQGFLAEPGAEPLTIQYPDSTSTTANGVNDAGVVIGSWNSGQGYQQVTHGFLRDAAGGFQTIEFPGAVSTSGSAISNAGWLTGTFTDGRMGTHGYVGEPLAATDFPALITIDVPGAYRTYAYGINAAGATCGIYQMRSFDPEHSFVRDASGQITTFDVPGAATTVAIGINDLGQVAGYWTPEIYGNIAHIFIREPSGEIHSFDTADDFSSAWGINDRGEMTINALTQPGPRHASVRMADGSYTAVNEPADITLNGLNNAGDITACGYGGRSGNRRIGYCRSRDGRSVYCWTG